MTLEFYQIFIQMRYLLVFALTLFCLFSQAQNKYWVFLSDKGADIHHLLESPEKYLSKDAIIRREARNIPVSYTDLPLNPAYTQTLKDAGFNIINSSKWLNALVIEGDDCDLEKLKQWTFIKSVQFVKSIHTSSNKDEYESVEPLNSIDKGNTYDYGKASLQNNMINIAALHSRGINGKGVRVAVFDGGFPGVDTIAAFDSLRKQGRLIAAYDFVDGDEDPFHASSHGTHVLSTIAANLPGKIVGTAPEVSVIIGRTEQTASETQQEEHNWVAAMEWADSIGVDIIHTSLGYTEFDDDNQSYTYKDMDGDQSIISRAADRAAAKGIIVTSSAGNEGSGRWRYISAPCDGDSVLCVGAVDRYRKRARFSSIGPSSDGQVKPDVVAMGTQVTVASPYGGLSSAQGTSFSAPIVAGLVACLVQAHPDRDRMDIVQAIRLSGDQYTLPDEEYGYGIPDAAFADSLLSSVKDLSTVNIQIAEKPQREIKVETTKVEDKKVEFTDSPQTVFDLSDNTLSVKTDGNFRRVIIMFGKQTVMLNDRYIDFDPRKVEFDLRYLIPGEYYLHVETDDYTENIKFNKG